VAFLLITPSFLQERSVCCLQVKSPWGPLFFFVVVAEIRN
jgi:hypothetical protein